MAYKTILAHIDSFLPSHEHTEQAIAIASQQGAHLIGIAPSGFADLPAGDYLGTSARYVAEMQQELDQASTKASVFFEQACQRAGFASFESRTVTESVSQAMLGSAAYADLIIVSQPAEDPSTTIAGPGLVGDLLMEACRPILVLPNGKAGSINWKSVLLAWDGSREASRAVIDAMPFLQAAERVEIVVVNASGNGDAHGEQPGADLAVYLARQGVTANVNQVFSTTSIGDCLLNQCNALGAELMVMGGYGHSRLREWVLGGATKDVLAGLAVPTLMSH